ncbi:MAG TPA: benzoate transporter [Oxalobacteraceae bacterium]|nr:benzoate transporter [Oxalobacteraceae bacterium]
MRRGDWSLSAVTAGFLAVLVSYSGPLVIFYQAAQAGHMPADMFASWVWGISIGAALSGMYLSWKLRIPVITAWSAPGTALLISLFPAISMHEVVGAYITAALIILAIGMSGYFEKLVACIPRGIASGMMAGILFQFGLNAFKAVTTLPLLALGMIAAYFVFKRMLPRYCIVLLLAFGVVLAALMGQMQGANIRLELVAPRLISPEWSWTSTFSLALPLVLTTLTGQYLPGMAVLNTSGYPSPMRPIITVNSIASVFVAMFGGITIAIAAITAAICTGNDAHEDPAKRYIAGIANGLFYLIGGLFGGTLVLLFAALPKELIAVLAGMALLGAIMVNLGGIVAAEDHRDASLVTFVATASGMSFLGLGSAFWGIVIGMAAYALLHHKPARR